MFNGLAIAPGVVMLFAAISLGESRGKQVSFRWLANHPFLTPRKSGGTLSGERVSPGFLTAPSRCNTYQSVGSIAMTLPAEISLGTVGGSRPTRFSQTTSTVSRSALGERFDAQTIQPLMPHVTCWNPVVNGSEDRSGLPSSGRNPIACRRKLPRSRLLDRNYFRLADTSNPELPNMRRTSKHGSVTAATFTKS
jgi:hypothetical protein